MPPIRWFLTYRFLAACLPYLPVASLCLSARGLSWCEVLELTALYGVASATLVLPVGALAQRIGTRRTLIVGGLALTTGAAIAATAADVRAFALAQLAFAIAAAIDAGIDSAYLWSLLGHDVETYRCIEARSTTGKLAGGLAGVALGGLLVTWSPSAPFAVAAVFALAAVVCASRLPDTQVPAVRGSLASAARALIAAAGSRRWLVIGIASCAVARVMASAIGPLLADAGLPLHTASAVVTGAALVASVAAAVSSTLSSAARRAALFGAAPLALIGLGLAAASARGALAAGLVALVPVIAAVQGPLWRAHLNQYAPAQAPRLLMLALDATLVRLVAATLPLIVTASSHGAPRAAMAGLGVALLGIIAMVAAFVFVLRPVARLGERGLRAAVALAMA